MSEITEKIDAQNVERAASHLQCLRDRFELISALGFIVSKPKESRYLFGATFYEQIVKIFQDTYIDD